MRAVRRFGCERARARPDRLLELTRRMDRVHEPPGHRALALDAFDERAEDVGEVAPHVPLVDDPRQTASAGQHAEQRRLRQAHGGVAIVDEDDLVAGQRELVAAAGADAVQRGEEPDAGVLRSRLRSPAASRW